MGRDDFGHYITTNTYAFTIDGKVEVFETFYQGVDNSYDPEVVATTTCAGPFRIGTPFCGYYEDFSGSASTRSPGMVAPERARLV